MVRLTVCLACCLCCTAIATSNPDYSTDTTTRETHTSKSPGVDPRANVMQAPKMLLLNEQRKAGNPDLAPPRQSSQ